MTDTPDACTTEQKSTMDSENHGNQKEGKVVYGILPGHVGGGPKGLGDPDDRTTRIVEEDVAIPKFLRERCRDKCVPEIAAFNACGKDAGFLLPFKCQKQSKEMYGCFVKWFNDPEFSGQVREEYFQQRAEYRRTGLTVKDRERLIMQERIKAYEHSKQNQSPQS